MKSLRNKLFIFFATALVSTTLFAQNENSLFGTWQLQKIKFKNTTVAASTNKELVLAIFNEALYKQLTKEQRLTLEELEQIKAEAEIMLYKYFQTTVEFKANGAFYSSSQLPDKSLSGEFLIHNKKLLLDWETGDKTNLKVLKNTSEALVLKDTELNISYYYLKT